MCINDNYFEIDIFLCVRHFASSHVYLASFSILYCCLTFNQDGTSLDEEQRNINWTLLDIFVTDGDDHGPVFVYDTCPVISFKACVGPKYTSSIVSGTTSVTVSMSPSAISSCALCASVFDQ